MTLFNFGIVDTLSSGPGQPPRSRTWWMIRHADQGFRLFWGGPAQGWVPEDQAVRYTAAEKDATALPRAGQWEAATG